MLLTPHFTLGEMIVSQTAVRMGIANTPNSKQVANLKALCVNILEPLRELAGTPINISSGFRNPIVNRLVGGSSNSQHMKGEAADFRVEGLTVQELFDLARTSQLPYDQLIQELDSWVHISFGPRNRRQALIFTKDANNKTVSRVA
jgi:zinc D-Ala-D-Ala carboxypeptidase